MSSSRIWVKLMTPEETPWMIISTDDIDDICDLKKAIKKKLSPELDSYTATGLILKVKKFSISKNNELAIELGDPRELMISVRRCFSDDCGVLVFIPTEGLEQQGLKRNRDTIDNDTDVDEEESRKLITLSTRKLKRQRKYSQRNLRQDLLINSVIERCGG